MAEGNVDFDVQPPLVNAAAVDEDVSVGTYSGDVELVVASTGGPLLAIWEQPEEPSAEACLDLVQRFADDAIPIEVGDLVCLRTQSERVAILRIEAVDEADGVVIVNGTVYEDQD